MSARPRMLPSKVPRRMVNEGAAQAEKCADHGHHFDVAEAHAFAASPRVYTMRRCPRAAGCRRRRRECASRTPTATSGSAPWKRRTLRRMAVPSPGGANQAENEAGEEAGAVDGIGEDADAQVGDGEDDDEADEDEPLEGFDGEAEAEVTGHEEEAGGELDQRVHRGDGERAGAAFAAEPEPAQNGNVIVGLDGRKAARAAGAGRDDGEAFRDARDAHIQKAADHDSEEEEEEEDHSVTLP